MDFIRSLFDFVFGPFTELFSRTFQYVLSCDNFIRAMSREMRELGSRRDDVERCVSVAVEQGMNPTSQLQWWMESVAALERDAAMIQEDFRGQPSSWSLWSAYQISKRADEMRSLARSLKSKGDFETVVSRVCSNLFMEMPSNECVGRERMLEELYALVQDDGVSVVGIHGMAGVGKSTLLHAFHNGMVSRMAHLDIIVCAEMPDDDGCDYEEEVQLSLVNQLRLPLQERAEKKDRAAALFSTLSKKKFLLIIDNLWAPMNLGAVGIPCSSSALRRSNSKIVLATRNEEVCDRMDVRRKMRVECLPWESSWALFQAKVGAELARSSLEMQAYAKELAENCGGLPSALVTVARAMASKRTVQEWKHATVALSTRPWQVAGMVDDVLSPLKRSYDRFRDDDLKSCLLYCAMFPPGFSISKTWVIDYCIGEEVIDGFSNPEEAYNRGYSLLGSLEAASLLERGDDVDKIRVHPVVRLLIAWLVSARGRETSRWVVRPGAGLAEAPDPEGWNRARRMSLMHNRVSALPLAPTCPDLLTLLLCENRKLAKIPDTFFQCMPRLRVLDLSNTAIEQLPEGIGALSDLQHLDASRTNLVALPQAVGTLGELRFLQLSWTPHLRLVPGGVISSLLQLRALHMYSSYADWETTDGANFDELESLWQLRSLDLTLPTVEALRRLAASAQLCTSTRRLHLSRCQGLGGIRLPAGTLWTNMNALQWLRISNCGNLEDITISVDGSSRRASLPSLQELVLHRLPKLKITWRGDLPFLSLRRLYVWSCTSIEALVVRDGPTASGPAASGATVCAVFPNVTHVQFVNLPELRNLVAGEEALLALPALEVFEVTRCPKLSCLSVATPTAAAVVRCAAEWWAALDWRDDAAKTNFKPVFV